jgi:hypothetical protein
MAFNFDSPQVSLPSKTPQPGKTWVPQQTQSGSPAWKNTATGEVRYQEEMPGTRGESAPRKPSPHKSYEESQVASEVRGQMREELESEKRKQLIGKWREKFTDRAEQIASYDIAYSDYQKLGELTDSGALSVNRASEIIDEAVSVGILDGKVGEYIKQKITPEPAQAERKPEQGGTGPTAPESEPATGRGDNPRELSDEILEILKSGKISLAELRDKLGHSNVDKSNPSSNPVHAALISLRNSNLVNVSRPQFGEPEIELAEKQQPPAETTEPNPAQDSPKDQGKMTATRLAQDIIKRGQSTLTGRQAKYLHSLAQQGKYPGGQIGRGRYHWRIVSDNDLPHIHEKGYLLQDPFIDFYYSPNARSWVEQKQSEQPQEPTPGGKETGEPAAGRGKEPWQMTREEWISTPLPQKPGDTATREQIATHIVNISKNDPNLIEGSTISKGAEKWGDKFLPSDTFILAKIPIDRIDWTGSQGQATEHKGKPRTNEPIVIDRNDLGLGRYEGRYGAAPDVIVADGQHRLHEARQRGDKSIMAFVGNKTAKRFGLTPVFQTKQLQEGHEKNLFVGHGWGGAHESLVKDAIASGKHVPKHVLAEYPDLAAQPERHSLKHLHDFAKNLYVNYYAEVE